MPLASFRRTADGPGGVVEAIDKFSQDIREKAGESLRSIRAEEPLEAVTTASLEALQKYAEAQELIDRGEYDRSVELLEETVRLDPDFAMAHRRLAVALQTAGRPMEEQQAAATRAYELREHLTDRERHLTEAFYHDLVTKDVDAQAGAYRRVLERHPDDQAALNNLAILFEFERDDPDSAIALLQRAVNGPGSSSAAHTNLPMYLAAAGRREEALAAEARAAELYPDRHYWIEFVRSGIAVYGGDWSRAHDEARALAELPRVPGTWKSYALALQATADAGRGHLGEAHRHLDEALRDALREGRWENA
ncbi:MAG TPA: tetratricopeptide repeat protein, partial [Longimicrobiales bacterium]|nr:tetratricopeptide repeat protein [Longimicrobiales bacterium]